MKGERPRVRVTHPFHPLCGREFELVTQKQAWGEDRVYFQDKSKRLRHMPLGWTSVAPVDPFKVAADGRCRFRTSDLLRLADLIDGLTGDKREKRKANDAASVKTITPTGRATSRSSTDPRRNKTRSVRRNKRRRRR